MSLKLNLIVACDAKMGIGVKNDLPWRLRKEMAYFNRMTTGDSPKDPGSGDPGIGKRNVVLMGRKTYDSIPKSFKPLKNRLNIVLSRSSEIDPHEDAVICKSWDDAMDYLSQPHVQKEIGEIWIIGGSHIYKLAIESPHCHRIYLTRLLQEFNCDTFFPEFDQTKFQLVKDPKVPEEEQEENGIKYSFNIYEKRSD